MKFSKNITLQIPKKTNYLVKQKVKVVITKGQRACFRYTPSDGEVEKNVTVQVSNSRISLGAATWLDGSETRPKNRK